MLLVVRLLVTSRKLIFVQEPVALTLDIPSGNIGNTTRCREY